MACIILHIDRRSISDLMFVQRMGRFLSNPLRLGHNVIVVHDGFDQAESIVEYLGEDIEGMSQESWHRVSSNVDSGVRGLNRRIVNTLTEEGVPAVGIMGSDRRLLVRTENLLSCRSPEVLVEMSRHGVIPVLGPFSVRETFEVVLEPSDAVVAAIEKALDSTVDATVVQFTPEISDSDQSVSSARPNWSAADDSDRRISVSATVEMLANPEFWERFS